MTQQTIRRFVLLYTIALFIITIVTTSYITQVKTAQTTSTYISRMGERVGYITAMFEWLPSIVDLDNTTLSQVSKAAPFIITVTPYNNNNNNNNNKTVINLHNNNNNNNNNDISLEDMVHYGIHVTSEYPFIARQYSNKLNAIISLQETFSQPPAFGPCWIIIVIGLCFIASDLMGFIFFIQIANITASLWPNHYEDDENNNNNNKNKKRYISYICVGIAFTFTLLYTVLLIYFIDERQSGWDMTLISDDRLRSVRLYSSTFVMLNSHYGGAFSLELFAKTLSQLNNFFSPGIYIYILNYNNKKIQPPAVTKEVEEILINDLSAGKNYVTWTKNKTFTIASALIPEYAVGIAEVENVAVRSEIHEDLPQATLLLGVIPSFIIFFLGIFFFPFPALGNIKGKNDWISPWEWRFSPYWHYKRFLFFCYIFFFSFIGVSLFVNAVMLNKIKTENLIKTTDAQLMSYYDAQKVGYSLADNYAGIILHTHSNEDYASQLNNNNNNNNNNIKNLSNNSNDITKVHFFYEQLILLNARLQYSDTATEELFRTQGFSVAPLLGNQPQVQEISKGFLNNNNNYNYYYLAAFLDAWDTYYIFFILTMNVEGLRKGCPIMWEEILKYALTCGGHKAVHIMNENLKQVFLLAGPYIYIAENYYLEKGNTRDLFNTSLGKYTMELEKKSFSNALAAIPPTSMYLSLHRTIIVPIIYILSFTIILLTLFGVWDVYYTTCFFGGLPFLFLLPSFSTSGYITGKKYIPSNDYTAPYPILTVHTLALSRLSKKIICYFLFFGLLSVFIIMVGEFTSNTALFLLSDTRELLNKNIAIVTARSQSCASMYFSCALWLRALLAGPIEIKNNIIFTSQWATISYTKWDDKQPTSLLINTGEKLNDFRAATYNMATFLSAQFADPNGSIYNDLKHYLIPLFDLLKKHNPTMKTCLPANEFYTFWHTMRCVLRDMVFSPHNNTIFSYYEDIIHTFNPSCLPPEMILIIQRLQALSTRASFYTEKKKMAEVLFTTAHQAVKSTEETQLKGISTHNKEAPYRVMLVYVLPLFSILFGVLAWKAFEAMKQFISMVYFL